jgi:hypothetical protein
MAALAQIRHFCIQQPGAGGTVGNMAAQAVFDNRGMLPKKRPSGFGVALETLQVDVLGIHQFIGNCSVGIVAIGTFHFALTNRMMGLSQQAGSNCLMAFRADFGLGGLCKVLAVCLMNTVAMCTG